MEFTIPQTKEEMMNLLREIYQYYHFKQLCYDGITLEELCIPKLEFETLTKEQLEEKAKILLAPEHDREIRLATERANEKILALKEKYAESFMTEQSLVSSAEESFDEAISAAKKEIWQNKVSDCSAVQNKIKEIQIERVKRIDEIKETHSRLRDDLSSEIIATENVLSELSDYYTEVHKKDVLKKVVELSLEQEKTLREIKKYNDGLEEKELRYRNTLKSNQANLELKYLSIHEQGFAHDELVEMGYYNDVIGCVSDYYNSIDAEAAYLDIKNEQKLVIYLEDYYSVLVQTYKIRSAQSV